MRVYRLGAQVGCSNVLPIGVLCAAEKQAVRARDYVVVLLHHNGEIYAALRHQTCILRILRGAMAKSGAITHHSSRAIPSQSA